MGRVSKQVGRRLAQISKAQVRMFDNGGKRGTPRYTAFIGPDESAEVYVLDDTPLAQTGVNDYRGQIGDPGWDTGTVDNYVEAMQGDLGQEVAFESLPKEVQEAVQGRMVKRVGKQHSAAELGLGTVFDVQLRVTTNVPESEAEVAEMLNAVKYPGEAGWGGIVSVQVAGVTVQE